MEALNLKIVSFNKDDFLSMTKLTVIPQIMMGHNSQDKHYVEDLSVAFLLLSGQHTIHRWSCYVGHKHTDSKGGEEGKEGV